MTTGRRILIEGWRAIPHSYALVNQFQILEMLTRPELAIAHRDLAYILPQWQGRTGIFSAEQEKILGAALPPAPGEKFDALYRIAAPFDFRAAESAPRTVVFGTAEFGIVPAHFIFWGKSVAEALGESRAVVVTPSNWSREGFLRSGAPADRVFVVPHGVDAGIFSPMEESRRAELRKQMGWEGFIFLTVGSVTENKGIDLLLKGLAAVSQRYPQTRLLIKGLDDLYDSRSLLRQSAGKLTEAERRQIEHRVHYRGETGALADMALLYQLADAYVTPYRAEGFCLPALEAAACGLPVICTRGGASDDFLRDDFSMRIQSRPVQVSSYGEQGVQLEPNLDHLVELMSGVIEKPEIGAKARLAGPEFVRSNYTWGHAVDKLLTVLFPQT
jgi:glycosyltransferase involved in cell wall biosynthesis